MPNLFNNISSVKTIYYARLKILLIIVDKAIDMYSYVVTMKTALQKRVLKLSIKELKTLVMDDNKYFDFKVKFQSHVVTKNILLRYRHGI